MKCPIDGGELKIADRQGIEIDYCPQCRGVWLDRGELDKIIERSGVATMPVAPPPQAQQASPPQYPQGERRDWDDDDDYYKRQGGQYPPKKRKSFLDDIFDF